MREYEKKRLLEEKTLMSKNPRMLEIILSKERTIESKLRTSISIAQTAIGLAALGFAVVKFFEAGAIHYMGYAILLLSFALSVYGVKRYSHYKKEIKRLECHHASLEMVVDDKGQMG